MIYLTETVTGSYISLMNIPSKTLGVTREKENAISFSTVVEAEKAAEKWKECNHTIKELEVKNERAN